MASGLARGAAARGKRIAFGDGHKIIWDHWSETIFGKRGTKTENPNVARPGDEDGKNLEWLPFYRGHRMYNVLSQNADKWLWQYEFKAIPGELYFSDDEHSFAERHGKGFVVLEPNVPENKSVANNKRWSFARFRKIARLLGKAGFDVRQFAHGKYRLPGVPELKTRTFRDAVRILQNAALYIGPEGGLHHGAAAVGIPGVVLFGGFIPPAVTGYVSHTNLTGGADACGSLHTCKHCLEAMDRIGTPEVMEAALKYLKVDA